MTSPSKTFVAGSTAFLLVAGAVGAQQMRIQRLEQLLRITPQTTESVKNVSAGEFGYYVDQLSKRIDQIGQSAQDNSQSPLFERDASFEAVQAYYFAHRSQRLAARTEFLRPTTSFFLDRFSLPNSIMDSYPVHHVSFGTGGNRGQALPDNERSVYTLSLGRTRDEWPPAFYFTGLGSVSVEVRALGLTEPKPNPPAADCPSETDAAILALVPYAREYAYGQISDADLCAAMKPYGTEKDSSNDPHLFTLQGQTPAGTWLPTVLFAYTTTGFSHTAIHISASTGKVSRDPTPEEIETEHKEAYTIERGVLSHVVKNVHFSTCEYACVY